MQELFLTVLEMSAMACVVILMVLLLRLCLKKLPRRYSYLLWAVVLFRLLVPSVGTGLSLLPDGALVFTQAVIEQASPEQEAAAAQHAGPSAPEQAPGEQIPATPVYRTEPAEQVRDAHGLQWQQLLPWLWLAGVCVGLAYGAVSLLRLRRRLMGAVRLEKNVWLADHIDTPFVVGLFRPRIYLPSTLEEAGREYILLHERVHIRRLDHVWRLLAYIALCIHWFDPLVWAAFLLSERDMELSCDEAVLRRLAPDGEDVSAQARAEVEKQIRADYSDVLLHVAARHRDTGPLPLAFCEVQPKARIRNALRFRDAPWQLACVAVPVAAVILVLLAVDPMPSPKRVTGEFTQPMLYAEFLNGGDEAYAIGANPYGQPVFRDMDAAMAVALADYAEGIEFMRIRGELEPLEKHPTRHTLQLYQWMASGEQIKTYLDLPEVSEIPNAFEIAYFLDIYLNGSEREYYGQSSLMDGPDNAVQTEIFRTPYFDLTGIWIYDDPAHNARIAAALQETSLVYVPEGYPLMDTEKGWSLRRYQREAPRAESWELLALSEPFAVYMPDGSVAYADGCAGRGGRGEYFIGYEALNMVLDEVYWANQSDYGRLRLHVQSGEQRVDVLPEIAGRELQWLAISPTEMNGPFRVFDIEGKERMGRYSICDAETGEALEFFLPSGLSPQTYLLQNAEPGGRYIITARFRVPEGGAWQTYEFGVILPEN